MYIIMASGTTEKIKLNSVHVASGTTEQVKHNNVHLASGTI